MKNVGIVLVDDLSEDDAMDDSPNFEGISGDGDDDKDGSSRWNPDMNDDGAPPGDSEGDWIYSEDLSCTDEDIIRQESEDSDDSSGNTDDDLPPFWTMEGDPGLHGPFPPGFVPGLWAGTGVGVTPLPSGSSDDGSDSDGSS